MFILGTENVVYMILSKIIAHWQGLMVAKTGFFSFFGFFLPFGATISTSKGLLCSQRHRSRAPRALRLTTAGFALNLNPPQAVRSVWFCLQMLFTFFSAGVDLTSALS